MEAPDPEDLDSTGAGNYLEVRLTVTDSEGLSRTVSRDVQPNRVNTTSDAAQQRPKLLIDGASVTAPETLTTVGGTGAQRGGAFATDPGGTPTSFPPGPTAGRRGTTWSWGPGRHLHGQLYGPPWNAP